MSWLWIWLATLCSFVSSNPPWRSSRSNFSDAPKNYCELYFPIILTACWYNNWLIVTLGQYQWLQELYILASFGFFCEVLLQEHCRILWIKHFTLRFTLEMILFSIVCSNLDPCLTSLSPSRLKSVKNSRTASLLISLPKASFNYVVVMFVSKSIEPFNYQYICSWRWSVFGSWRN